ncbi:MAG: hypothetical protein ACYTEK_19675 [Planctomycetota bacterium]|jgi:type IV secretory pathway VirB3-like protein
MMELLVLVLVIIGALFVIASGVWVAAVLVAVTSRRRPKSDPSPDTLDVPK